MSLLMMLEGGKEGASEYTMQEFTEWARQVGFRKTEKVPLMGPVSAAVAYK